MQHSLPHVPYPGDTINVWPNKHVLVFNNRDEWNDYRVQQEAEGVMFFEAKNIDIPFQGYAIETNIVRVSLPVIQRVI